ncbi:hypothetical protein KIW84_055226 [Lathyrus oleraceus]|uniref:Uncharacterized protein n=1 Tax=Pisum sativum TaxID=3888 RepID=A0A9D4WXL6_PEA|nr:hypothetical protein KIW84_055226 [Pisum sativum]
MYVQNGRCKLEVLQEAHAVTSHVKSRRPSVRRKTVRPASSQHQVAHIAPVFRDNQQYQQHSNNQQSPQQYQQQQHRPQQQAYQPQNSNPTSTSYERKKFTFDPIQMTYAELYPSLIERKLITPRDPPAIPANPQWWYKPELHYVYHSGAPGHDVENCYPLKTKVRKDLQEMLDEGVIEILQNKNADEDEPEVNVISPVFRMPEPCSARSGRVFSAPPKPQANADCVIRPIGNAVNPPNPALAVKPSSVLKTPTSIGPSGNVKEDCDEMLRLIKKKPHREALQKVLDVAYVDHDVTIEQFDNIVANITACNNLSFCDSDLPEEGRDHNLALHISMNCKDDTMSNVLVDTGSSLNVLRKSTLSKLSYQGPPMRQSGVVVKAFDGS